ncbi:alpha/beta hydrolase [Rhodococcus opacus]|uniref:alpha/beta hydrolase n=1 Tax=Rhodococcus opacus TaxID=37919 RepID=UPI000FFC560C|nr:alpha/beta hydrolase [Rhodococcus opacus]
MTQHDVTIPADHGINLGGTLYLPGGSGKHPAITMAHGYGGVKEQGAQQFAEAFANAGFVVLLHDHRNFGASGGTPRQDIDPWQQIADWRRVISYLESRPEVAADRIGLWGTSYAGGHALVLGATDCRLKAVVAQVPTISGFEQGRRRVAPEAAEALEESFAEDERAQLRGEAPRRIALVSADPTVAASYYDREAVDFYLQPIPDQIWQNSVTLRSMRAARMYEPGVWVERLSPTPLLMVVATEDTVTPADLALAAYERALEPKKLQLVPGGHFDPYTQHFALASGAAVAWFSQHLVESATHEAQRDYRTSTGNPAQRP